MQIPAKLSERSRIQNIEMLEDGGRLKVSDRTDNPVLSPSSVGLAQKIPNRMKQKFHTGSLHRMHPMLPVYGRTEYGNIRYPSEPVTDTVRIRVPYIWYRLYALYGLRCSALGRSCWQLPPSAPILASK